MALREATVPKSTFVLVTVVFYLLCLHNSHVFSMPRPAICKGGCFQDRGILEIPLSLFGYCRCRCKAAYAGPRCEFLKSKRNGYKLQKLRKLIRIRNNLQEVLRKRMEIS